MIDDEDVNPALEVKPPAEPKRNHAGRFSKLVKSATMKFTVPLKPHVKSRPKFNGKTKHAYNESGYEDWKAAARVYAMEAWGKEQLTGPLSVAITLYHDHFDVEIEPVDGDFQSIRGDIDNLIGGILDALQPKKRRGADGKMKPTGPAVIRDDSQVVIVFARKAQKGEP